MQLLRSSRESNDVLNCAEIATEKDYLTFDPWILILIVHNSFHNRILDSKSLLLLYTLKMKAIIYTC